jgi:hypothetical protein
MRYALINLRKKMKKYNIAYDQNIYPQWHITLPV